MKTFIIFLALVFASGKTPTPKIIQNGKEKIEFFSLKDNFEHLGLPPKYQGTRGTCASFAVTGALEYEWAKQNLKNRGTRLSENYLVWAKQKRELFGKKQDAGDLETLIYTVKRYGICREEFFPYTIVQGISKEPPNSTTWEAKQRTGIREYWIKKQRTKLGMSKTEFDDIMKALRWNHPVVVGITDWREDSKNKNLTRQSKNENSSNHAVLITGYKKVIGNNKKFWIEYRDSATATYSFMPVSKLEKSLFEAVYFEY